MKEYYAVLIDTASIQQYVFGSSKLKENLGASHLIKDLYKDIQVSKACMPDVDGYIGGGNALMFFNSKEKVNSFIKEYSRRLLMDAPGVNTVFAVSELPISESDFENKDVFMSFKNSLFDQLATNKGKYALKIMVPPHGITADCSRTGFTMDIWEVSSCNYISSVSYAKIENSKMARKKLEIDYDFVYKAGLTFTDELEQLGSSKGEDSHIAIVHIDGNDMGERFKKCSTLTKIKELSSAVENTTQQSFVALLQHILDNFNNINIELGLDKQNKIIPIRPIILGGDDITFVCDGRLGIYFAQKFLENFENEGKKLISVDGNGLSACAGIAITKLKYPFYRGYRLSEELCSNAKKTRRSKNDSGSWLDFHISFGGFSGSLEGIRKKFNQVPQGELLLRPYKLIDSDDDYSFSNMIKNTRKLASLPNSKIKELREAITLGEDVTRSFINHIKAQKLDLPFIENDNLYRNKKTPYYDMIELIELYPEFAI